MLFTAAFWGGKIKVRVGAQSIQQGFLQTTATRPVAIVVEGLFEVLLAPGIEKGVAWASVEPCGGLGTVFG